MPRDLATNERRGNPRRKWPWIVLGLAMLLLLPLSWLLAHRFSSRRLPAPPWSERELAAIPAAAENGLDDVVLPGGWTLSVVDPELSPLAGVLGTQTPDARWAQVGRGQRLLRSWFDADHERRARELAQIDAVLALPRFADPCGSVGTDCRMIELIKLARMAALADLGAALRGDWVAAFERALALWVASEKLLPSVRTALGDTVALVVARMATDHLRVLVAGYRADVAGGSSRVELSALRSMRDAILAELDAVRRQDLSARRAVIAECLWVHRNLVPVLENPASLGGGGGGLMRYAVDVRATVAVSDARFVELMRWVEAPDHATRSAPPFREYASGTGWWLWNPGGKVILDLVSVDLSPMVARIDEHASALVVSRDALGRELGALRP